MLTSSGPGGISAMGMSKGYYTNKIKRESGGKASVGQSNYDSATFTQASEASAFQKALVGRLSGEVRTNTTTGDIQALRESVASGAYQPDPMAIAGRMLLLVGD